MMEGGTGPSQPVSHRVVRFYIVFSVQVRARLVAGRVRIWGDIEVRL